MKKISEGINNIMNDMLKKHKGKFKKYNVDIDVIKDFEKITDIEKRVNFKYYMQYYLQQSMGKHIDSYMKGNNKVLIKLYPVIDGNGKVINELCFKHYSHTDEPAIVEPVNKTPHCKSYEKKVMKINDKDFKYFMPSIKELTKQPVDKGKWAEDIL
jgi:dihydroorotase